MNHSNPEVDFWLDVQRELETVHRQPTDQCVRELTDIASDSPDTTHSTRFITPSRERSRRPSLAVAFSWALPDRSLAGAGRLANPV